ncbi:MAG TPA: ribonuclease H [Gemmatimonadales bacterium]|nr:ribonuclease H [Gemmatimonadales bacterium]
MTLPIAVIHLDESCLGNGQAGATPGGAGGIIEMRHAGAIERRDFWLSAADTTNNRMALAGAIAFLRLLAAKGHRFRLLGVSDSQYLVKGIREWLPGWVAKGWRRQAGPIENLELWQELHAALRLHEASWAWVRGHQGHAKNEFANDLAVRAATEQTTSDGATVSTFDDWLALERRKKRYLDYDADAAFAKLEALLAEERPVPLALKE